MRRAKEQAKLSLRPRAAVTSPQHTIPSRVSGALKHEAQSVPGGKLARAMRPCTSLDAALLRRLAGSAAPDRDKTGAGHWARNPERS